jgi:hypothetical protein
VSFGVTKRIELPAGSFTGGSGLSFDSTADVSE